MTSPPPLYANLSHTETQHAMPASDITVEHGESDHTQGTDQVYHNRSRIVKFTIDSSFFLFINGKAYQEHGNALLSLIIP